MSDIYPQFHVVGFVIKGQLFKTMVSVNGQDNKSLLPRLFPSLEAVNSAEIVCDLTTRKMLKNRYDAATEVDDMLFGLLFHAEEIDSRKVIQKIHEIAG